EKNPCMPDPCPLNHYHTPQLDGRNSAEERAEGWQRACSRNKTGTSGTARVNAQSNERERGDRLQAEIPAGRDQAQRRSGHAQSASKFPLSRPGSKRNGPG